MGSFGQVSLKAIWRMLDNCAPGHTREAKLHNYIVRYLDRTFPNLPLGKHGRRDNPPIQIGHVRQMVRQLKLDPGCVKRFIEQF